VSVEKLSQIILTMTDVMHTCWSGTAKKFADHWCGTGRFAMHIGDIRSLNERLQKLKLPNNFSRKPRAFSPTGKACVTIVSKILAVEFQNFTLYFFPALTKDLLDRTNTCIF
jgi:hypothetical protein